MTRFEVLPGLPAYGDLPEQFSATGLGKQSEGLVVRIEPLSGAPWVGNYQRGLSSHDDVLEHPNGRNVLVIAGGQGYVVDPDTRIAEYHGGAITGVLRHGELVILVHQGLWFEAFGDAGPAWRSRRLSVDGFRDLRIEAGILTGLAWGPWDPEWVPFSLDLHTGESQGGQSFP